MIYIQNRSGFYIGVDTHKYVHTACVMNYDTDNVLTFTFKNEPQYYEYALHKILEVTRTKNIIFGLEDVHSFGLLLSHYLTNLKYGVKHVNLAFTSAYRELLLNYDKSNEFDAFCISKVLKDSYKQRPRFRYEQLFSNIRLLVSQRTILTKQKTADYKLLYQQLDKVYPGYTQFSAVYKPEEH